MFFKRFGFVWAPAKGLGEGIGLGGALQNIDPLNKVPCLREPEEGFEGFPSQGPPSPS